jgi:hypothetical protein
MPRVSHLIRRNGVYWFKIDLPNDLAGKPLPSRLPDVLKPLESPARHGHLKTAVWLSLRTTVGRVAMERVGLQIATYASLFDATRAFLFSGAATPCLLPQERQAPAILPIGKPALEQGLAITMAFQSWSSGGESKGAKKPAPNTVVEADAALRRFVDLFGDMPIQHIGKVHGRAYRDAISKLPKGLPSDLRRLPLKELLQRDLSAYEPRSAVQKSLSCVCKSVGSARKFFSFSEPAYRPHRLTPCCSRCWIRSTVSARNATA